MKSKILLLLLVLILSSCSLNRFVVGQMSPVFKVSADALYEETDLKLAEQAIAANLKLLEGLLKNDPENEELLLLLAQGYAGYALGFVEDDDPERAKLFYDRAFLFGVRALLNENIQSWKWSAKNRELLEGKIRNSGKSDVAAMFWTNFSLAGKLNLSLADPAALIHLPLIEKMIAKTEQFDPKFFHGAVYLMKGSIAGMRPKMLGGNPEVALQNFDKSIKLTEGKFLLSYIYKSRFYAAKTLDEDLFDDLIQKIENFDLGTNPEIALFNQIAKKKAKLLKEQKEDMF
ncbi:MAG: hypothetical protein D8M58_11385 [Calditrichaeota bacterium]|nr:MAG: hypothetical protein DWQ03_10760 [Calditrichota bacterium]MBL1205996.1 hypothetical protein [Calditrichota bacterium]NOG45824.1 hypothetical protein [Calditrichota bacterium]